MAERPKRRKIDLPNHLNPAGSGKAAVGGTLAPVCFTEFCNTGSLCYC